MNDYYCKITVSAANDSLHQSYYSGQYSLLSLALRSKKLNYSSIKVDRALRMPFRKGSICSPNIKEGKGTELIVIFAEGKRYVNKYSLNPVKLHIEERNGRF